MRKFATEILRNVYIFNKWTKQDKKNIRMEMKLFHFCKPIRFFLPSAFAEENIQFLKDS